VAYSTGGTSDWIRFLIARIASYEKIGFVQMKKKKVTISSPVAIAGVTVILVVELSLNCQPSGSGIFFSGIKQPVRVVVASPSTKKAFDITGEEISLGELMQEAPSLAEVLERA
jgi:hypothetical protein